MSRGRHYMFEQPRARSCSSEGFEPLSAESLVGEMRSSPRLKAGTDGVVLVELAEITKAPVVKVACDGTPGSGAFGGVV